MKKDNKYGLARALTIVCVLGFALAHPNTAPEFSPSGRWFNSAAFRLSSLRGKVVLLDFFTVECGNCERSLPTVRGFFEKYKTRGLTVVGIHTPETKWQMPAGKVAAVIKREKIKWAVFQDNQYQTWDAYNNRYFPTFYLIDKHGTLRETHVGEISKQYPEGIKPFEESLKKLLEEK
jgi:thiol-disulfide isomerase/thioredoxin